MPVELIENAETKLLEVRVSGKLTADDYETLEPGVEKLIASSGKIKILFIMHDFHGWDLGAVWEDTKFATTHCRDIEKVAMVGEKTWEKWMATICKPFTMSSIKYFDAGEEEAARAADVLRTADKTTHVGLLSEPSGGSVSYSSGFDAK